MALKELSARVVAIGLTWLSAATVGAQERPPEAALSLDSLLNTRISAASRYEQRAAEAPASVTIVTADDIRQFGYRNVEEVLENVRGFYISNDHNYPYLGVRGFGRPTDYNNRILLLIDGHRLNDDVWGGARIGSDLPINLDAVERIEIVRGPGSVLYGTSAMFAVINIVTKNGTEIDGMRAHANVGSMGYRQVGVAGGSTLGTAGSISGSLLASSSDGPDLYFPEFDDPATANGRASGLDWEDRLSGMGSMQWGNFTVRAGNVWRAKGIPTGSFETIFGDDRTKTVDNSMWAEVEYQTESHNAYRLTTRLFADRYDYEGTYAYMAGPTYRDEGTGTTVGGEAMLIWDASSRSRLTIGTEIRRVVQARYREFMEDGSVFADDAPMDAGALFAQNEFNLLSSLTTVAGLRVDKMSGYDAALSPRAALIATPDGQTTIKALYGEAFRAPSAAEARLTTSLYEENPNLDPERVRTLEFSLQRRLARELMAGVSAYDYRISGLIDPVQFDPSGTLQYRNIAASRGRGLELELDLLPSGPVSGRVTYAWQRTNDEATDEDLTNSPARVATVSLLTKMSERLRSAAVIRHETGRLTLAGTTTPAFVRTDINIGYVLPVGGPFGSSHSAQLSLRVTNLFDERYYAPGGLEHIQAAIEQGRRALSLRLDWHY
jgi:iron complex outermembrane receptor protein